MSKAGAPIVSQSTSARARNACVKLRDKLGLKPHDTRLPADKRAVLEAASRTFDEGGISFAAAARLHDISANSLRSWRAKQAEHGFTGDRTVLRRRAQGRCRTARAHQAADRGLRSSARAGRRLAMGRDAMSARPGPTHCAECGEPLAQIAKAPTRIYCGIHCKRRAQQRRRPRKKLTVVARSCKHCDKLLPPPHPHGGGPREYCNDKCRSAARREKETRGTAQKHCKHCAKPLSGIATKQFCNNACNKRWVRAKKRMPSPREVLVMLVGWPDQGKTA